MAMVTGIGCTGCVRFGINVREWHDREVQVRDAFSFGGQEKGKVSRRGLRTKLGRVTMTSGGFGACGGEGVNSEMFVGVEQVQGNDTSTDGWKKVAAEELDHWLQSFVPEIVKNMSKAPLLVQVYKESGPVSSLSQSTSSISSSSNTKIKFVIEKATQEIWPVIKQRWENSSCTIPNGIIFVEELECQDKFTTSQQQGCQDETRNLGRYTISSRNSSSNTQLTDSSSSTRLWGIVVQGIGLNFPSFYLLKTCQVQSCFGFSTHFCLAKADCFGKSVDYHLDKLWL